MNAVQVQRSLAQAEQTAAIFVEIGAAASIESACEALLRGAITMLDGCHGVLRLFDQAHESVRFGMNMERIAPDDFVVLSQGVRGAPRPGSFAESLLAGGPPVAVMDTRDLDPATYPWAEHAQRRGHRASVNVPIVAQGRRIGSLHVNHTQRAAFGAAELALAESLAAQAGVVIERVLAQEALRESEARYRRHFEDMPVPAYTWQHRDGEFVLIDANTAAREVTRGRLPTILGITARVLCADQPEALEDFARCAAEQRAITREMTRRMHTTGEEGLWLVTWVPIPPDLVVMHTLDLTAKAERARLDGALLAARTAAHLVNNQLSTTVGFSELLASRPDLPERQREMARLALDGAREAATTTIQRLNRIVPLEEAPDTGTWTTIDLERSTNALA